MDSEHDATPDYLEWDDVLATAKKDLRNGRLILSAIGVLFVGLLWGLYPAARGGTSSLGEMSPEGAYFGMAASSLVVLLAAASWLRPIPAFAVARWLALGLAILNATMALLLLVKAGGLKVVIKHAFKFASAVWGAEIMREAHGGAVILAGGPNVEDHFNEVMEEVKSDRASGGE